MLWLVFLTCVLADAFNAASSLVEREASKGPGMGRLFSKKLSSYILKNKKFLLGIFLQLGATALELVALSQGSLVLIGPLMALDIVFLWLFISWRSKLIITKRNWLAVASTVAGLSLLFISTQPKSGQANYSLIDWGIAIGFTAVLIVFAVTLSKSRVSAKALVVVLSLATACNYALNAGLAKLVLNQADKGGIEAIFLSWPFYLVLIFAIISVVLTQNTYRVGPVALAQPVIEIAQAVTSVLIGIFIFDDVINRSWFSLAGLSLSLVIIGLGVSLLATSEKLFDNA